jgi:NAD(P)H dehydrogenase (quinone)
MSSRKHAVVVAHPNPDSFTLSVAHRYCAAAQARGYRPVLRDLYRMGFDPRLRSDEIPRPGGFGPAEDVKAERSLVGDADVFVFVYPLWFYDRPAILKGYIDRVFGMGFGYGPIAGGRNQPLLAGRGMLSFTSSGSPLAWLQEEGTWAPILTLLDSHLSRVCGFSVLDHVHFGEVTPGLSDTAACAYLDSIDPVVARLFPMAAEAMVEGASR